MSHDTYQNPLVQRYASREMSGIWSERRKFSTWRRLWIALAEAEQELDLSIRDEQIAGMRQFVDDVNFEVAQRYEREKRHDVMAHVHAFGDQCPDARPIIHLGATSCFVTDNTDLILLRDALQLTCQRLAVLIDRLAAFALQHRDLACLGFTHMQTAQPTTMGKRACLWLYDFVMDLTELEHRLGQLKARSTKGTTGTQASFLKLFNGDHQQVRQLEQRVAAKIGFEQSYAVTGQTYSRKVDSQILDALSGVAQSAHKMATDVRLLAHRRELEEPFEAKQIGSSAMAYKRNPMRSERICSLARYAMGLPAVAAQTLATQWMERTLDDSACRRIILPQSFLAVDAVLKLCQNITAGFVVYPKVIQANLNRELPFMATENILMAAVAQGGDRQTLHELIRQHSQDAAYQMKAEGKDNDLITRLKQDAAFQAVDIDAELDVRQFVGRAPEQVDEFLAEIVAPIRKKYDVSQGADDQIHV